MAPRPRRALKLADDRFISSINFLGASVQPEPAPDPGVLKDLTPLVIDVVRSLDLFACRVVAYGCEVAGGATPVLRPAAGESGILVFNFGFQHLGEQATYAAGTVPCPDGRQPAGPPKNRTEAEEGPPGIPIAARPSRSTRLVLDVPQGTEIDFTTAGLLDALGTLAMRVHPLAVSGTAKTTPTGDSPGIQLELPGGLIGRLSDGGVVFRAAKRGELLDPGDVADLVRQQRNLRVVRTVLSNEVGLVSRLGASEPSNDGVLVSLGTSQYQLPPLLGGTDSGGLITRIPKSPRPFRRPTYSRPARADETAIEAPYRLVISPDVGAGWAHSTEPVSPADHEHRVELWHTRLGRRAVDGDGTFISGPVDERVTPTRVVRAVWARDRERFADPLQPPVDDKPLDHDNRPFRMSLDGKDRHMLVRQSAESWRSGSGLIEPSPIEARELWLSSLGAWLDLHGVWDTKPYSDAQPEGMDSILSWDHVAPLGRDQYVRVVYPGYLYPFGHKAALVKVTERRMKDATSSVAALYQRKFIVVGEATKRFDQRDLPFREVRLDPLVTPTLSPDPGTAQTSYFWPMVEGEKFRWIWHCLDAEMHPVRLVAPLIWVAEAFGRSKADFDKIDQLYSGDAASSVPASGQKIAFAPVLRGGDTVVSSESLRFGGDAQRGGSSPWLQDASVTVPAVAQLAPTGPITIAYADVYKSNGFAGAANSGEVWAAVVTAAGALPKMAFGGDGASSGSDKAGGFLTPTMPIEGLSRQSGVVGDIAGMATRNFDPVQFLKDSLPKLFGVIPLYELVTAVAGDLTKMPNIVSETLERVEGFLADLSELKAAIERAVEDAKAQVARSLGRDDLNAAAQSALGEVTTLEAQISGAVDEVVSTLSSLVQKTEAEVQSAIATPLDALRVAVGGVDTLSSSLTPLARNELTKAVAAVRSAIDTADLIIDMFRMLNGLATGEAQARFHFEWRPDIEPWPSGAHPFLGITDPIFIPANKQGSLVLSVDGRVSGKDQTGVEVLAEIRDFTLVLLPGTPLVELDFDRLFFKAGSAGKAEVDVVLKRFEFVGILGFVETLRDLIPFDGFSDPPFLEVSPERLSAGFTLALPNVALGIFALSNISLGADLQVPFVGGELSVGFNFCSRERPFTLQVAFIGGGGWFLLRISPKGLAVLEVGLEAGATVSVDLVVASGSISAMIGVYLRLEGSGGSLSAYFRLRGAVDVLGLVSASIELYLELHYVFDTGKLVGRAEITVQIDIFMLSIPVKISCERQFAGSKGDPTFRQMMAVEGGESHAWDEYCSAFVGGA